MRIRLVLLGFAGCAGLAGSAAAQVIVDDAGTARNGKVGYWSSIVAGKGDAAISYYCEDDSNNNPPSAFTLRFAWATGSAWQWTTVDYDGGSDTSMARGSSGLYQIVYASWAGMGWATGAATNWSVSSVDVPAGVAPANISMVLDAADHAHVAYMDYANGGSHALRYTYFDGAKWTPGGANGGVIASGIWTPTIGFSNTYLKLDAAGTPHVAYAQPSGPLQAYGPIKYATLQGGAGGTWQIESVGAQGEDPSLAIGHDNLPRLAFNGDAGLVYAFKEGGAWKFETVVAGNWGSSVSLALSDTDVPVLSFGMTANEDMYVAKREPQGWVVTKVDGDGSNGPHVILGRYGTAVDVDETGQTHVSYLAIDIYSTTHRCDLKYFGPGGGPPPCVQISSAPLPASPCGGGNAAFSVTASSAEPLSYQWRLNGAPLSDGPTPGGSVIYGATTPDLAISGVTPGDEGAYDCVVSASCGSATSLAAGLTIAQPPSITSPPASANACVGAAAAFSVTASGGGLSYAWYHDNVLLVDGPTGSGSSISGATTANLTISGVTNADAGLYHSSVSNGCGESTSAPATLTVKVCGECIGDLNEDGKVDQADLGILLSHYGETGVSPNDGDLDGDGDVDQADLGIFLAHYGTVC